MSALGLAGSGWNVAELSVVISFLSTFVRYANIFTPKYTYVGLAVFLSVCLLSWFFLHCHGLLRNLGVNLQIKIFKITLMEFHIYCIHFGDYVKAILEEICYCCIALLDLRDRNGA